MKWGRVKINRDQNELCWTEYSTKSIFRPTFGHRISIFYSSSVSFEQKEANCTIFAKKFCIDFCTDDFKENLHIFSFS